MENFFRFGLFLLAERKIIPFSEELQPDCELAQEVVAQVRDFELIQLFEGSRSGAAHAAGHADLHDGEQITRCALPRSWNALAAQPQPGSAVCPRGGAV